MSQNQPCQLNWTINATGDLNTDWKVGVLFNSSSGSITDNHTSNSTVSIYSCTNDISLWSPATIDFGSPFPNTNWNNATNNTINFYNITVNSGSCSLDLWIKGTYLENITMGTRIGVGNMTWNNYDNYMTSTNMTTTYTLINSSVSENINVTKYYWLNLPPISAGRYNGTATICGNSTTGGSVCT